MSNTNSKYFILYLALFLNSKIVSQSLNLSKFKSVSGNSIFNDIAIGTLVSKFKVIKDSYPKKFSPVAIKEFKFQNGLSDEEFYRLNRIKILFGFINGNEYFIIDSNNDNNFLSEKIYDVKKINQTIYLNDVEFLFNNQIVKRSATIKYIESSMSFGSSKIKNIFVIEPFYYETKFEVGQQNYNISCIDNDYNNFGLNNKIRFSFLSNSDNSKISKDRIIYYKIGDTISIYQNRVVLQNYSTNPLSINIKLLKAEVNFGYDIKFDALKFKFDDILTNKSFDIQGSQQYILLDFWGTWCNPCIELLPKLKNMYTRYHNEKFIIYGIAYDDDLNEVKKYLQVKNVKWPNAFDKRSKADIIKLYKIQAFPTFILIDPTGKIIYRGIGKSSLEQIDKLLSNH